MLYTLALILLATWLLALGVFHVSTSLVHVLMLMAVISFAWHWWEKSRRRAS